MQWLHLHSNDNVVVVVDPDGLPSGTVVQTANAPAVRTTAPILRGHKIALGAIPQCEPIIKFGHIVGDASRSIAPGEHVHTHNMKMPAPRHQEFHSGVALGTPVPLGLLAHLPTTFLGYPRPSGRAGVRNYIVVVASVNCSATVVKAICRHFEGRSQRLLEKEIHGVIPVTHGAGCAQASEGLGSAVLNRTLAGWIFHPNVVAAIVVGLGCEKTTTETILAAKARMGLVRDVVLEQLLIQDAGGTATAIRQGIDTVQRVIDLMPSMQRERVPVSELAIALNCGGSDAFSSLTANPLLGRCSDYLAALGASSVLAEITECTGAEELLCARAVSPQIKSRLHEIFAWWQAYAQRHQVAINDNLSSGNIASGITTIVEKSLGAVSKAGNTPLCQVVDYAEPVTAPGFVLMNTPGFDPVSVTGLVAGGCNLVVFTTGRGSVYGCSIAPTLKVATTTELFQRMQGDMDVDAGQILAGRPLEESAIELFRMLVEVASGKATCSELLGLGREEFVPWPVGETL